MGGATAGLLMCRQGRAGAVCSGAEQGQHCQQSWLAGGATDPAAAQHMHWHPCPRSAPANWWPTPAAARPTRNPEPPTVNRSPLTSTAVVHARSSTALRLRSESAALLAACAVAASCRAASS